MYICGFFYYFIIKITFSSLLGYEWVGWKNDSSFARPIEIIFTFDQVRNFSDAYFYCNNMHTKEVQVFSSARIWFSIGGKYFNGPPVNFSYMPDIYFENARNVTIPLYHRIGKYVKVELVFASKWILISEVVFKSSKFLLHCILLYFLFIFCVCVCV